jgi:pseudaminic acid cytidylyltransferase
MKKIAIITARGGSKRIPKKNIRNFLGKPIIAYSIESALKSKLFDEVMVSTDDKKIAGISLDLGANVPFYRSEKKSNDFATTADVLLEVIGEYKKRNILFDYGCCIYPTAPFISSDLLKKSYKNFISKKTDSLIPIVKFSYPIQRALKINNQKLSFFYPKYEKSRSQDLEKAYHDAGMFYWFNVNKFLKAKSLLTGNTTYLELEESRIQDIDTQEDWKLAEMKYKMLKKQ